MGYAGMISFGQAAYLGIGGYTAACCSRISPDCRSTSAWRGAGGGALAALVIGYFCVRRTHIYFAILTLAFGHIVYLIAFKWYNFTGGDNGLIGIPVPAGSPSRLSRTTTSSCSSSASSRLPLVAHRQLAVRQGAYRHPENPERADFIGIPVDRYRLYAFVLVGAFSGLAGALIMVNERSVHPDLAHWTQSTQVLLMVLLGGVTRSSALSSGAAAATMDAEITQNYPEIWQLFLGAVLVLILFGLPGGIVGFIQERDVDSGDDHATGPAKCCACSGASPGCSSSAPWCSRLLHILQSPGAWLLPRARIRVFSLPTWGIVPCALLQLVVGGAALWLLLRRADRFDRVAARCCSPCRSPPSHSTSGSARHSRAC